jgi:5'-nucleotidase
MNKIALLDLDGTLADYNGAMARDMAKMYSPDEQVFPVDDHNVPSWIDARQDAIKRQPGWWRNLTPIGTNLAVVETMRSIGYRLTILTKGPSSKSAAWAEKVDWARQWVPDANITITEDKSGVFGRVLFDDYVPYVEGWLKNRKRGLVIMPKTRQNADFSHPRVVHYDGNNLGAVRWALDQAFNRQDKEVISFAGVHS